MAASLSEQNIRRSLQLTRLMLGYLPIPTMRWFQSHLGGKERDGIMREAVTIDGVRCEWLIPDNSGSEQVLLYLHGGGFVYGWSYLYRQMVSYLAHQMGMRALAVDYRLAPEHPFPAALDDCTTAYRWLLKQDITPENVVIAGDSAGGNLTLATLLNLRNSGDPLPAAAACISPPVDFTDPDLFRRYHDAILHPRATDAYMSGYVANHDPHDPLTSPIFADLHGLPPLLIHVGEEEAMCESVVRFADLAQKAGVSVRVEVYPHMWHDWHLYFSALPQGIQALDDIGQFLKSKVGALASPQR